jgi:hypothetical protein
MVGVGGSQAPLSRELFLSRGKERQMNQTKENEPYGFLHPEWDKAGKVHDWRNYASEEIMVMWEGFTPEQRLAIARMLDGMASNEEWD